MANNEKLAFKRDRAVYRDQVNGHLVNKLEEVLAEYVKRKTRGNLARLLMLMDEHLAKFGSAVFVSKSGLFVTYEKSRKSGLSGILDSDIYIAKACEKTRG